MQLQLPPRYFRYLLQTDATLSELFAKKRADLSIDWIKLHNKEVFARRAELASKGMNLPAPYSCAYAEYKLWSTDYQSNDFPDYENWPKEWQDAAESARCEAEQALKRGVGTAEKHIVGNATIYLCESDGKVWISTPYHNYGEISEAVCTEKFDSTLTAAYAFINDYRDWENRHGNRYRAANILSSSDTRTKIDSLIGTTQECDGCAAYTKIVKDDGVQALCCKCSQKLQD